MEIQKTKIKESGVVVLLLGYLYFSWNYMSISNDALYQLTVLNNYFSGYGYMDNLIINKNYIAQVELLKWWTPFPYLFPYFLSKLFFISYSHAISLCLFFSMIFSCLFLRRIIELFEVKKNIGYLILVIFICQRTVNLSFLQYTGGDMFIYPIGLYNFIIFYKKIMGEKKVYFHMLFLIISLIGILFKTNYIILTLSMLGVLFFQALFKKNYKEIVYQIVIFLGISILVLFFSTGSGTAISNNKMNINVIAFLQFLSIPALGILFSFFGIHSILANVPSKENTYFDIMNFWAIEGTVIGFLIVIISVFITRRVILQNKLISLFLIIYSTFYTFLYLKGSYVGHEDRYFFIPSIILFVVLVKGVTNRRMIALILCIGFLSSCYGLWNFSYRFKRYSQNSYSLIRNSDFGELRVPISSEQVKALENINSKIRNKYKGYAVYTSNENYFCLNTEKPLIHDWNFQFMGFEKFDLEKFEQINFDKNAKLKGILFISPEKLLKAKEPIFELSGSCVYELKNKRNAN
jgi:hypothetical protein